MPHVPRIDNIKHYKTILGAAGCIDSLIFTLIALAVVVVVVVAVPQSVATAPGAMITSTCCVLAWAVQLCKPRDRHLVSVSNASNESNLTTACLKESYV